MIVDGPTAIWPNDLRKEDEMRGVMYHESGHATLAHVLGESVEEVSAIRDGSSYGHMQGLPLESEYVARSAVFGRDPEAVHRRLLVMCAGPVAEFLAAGCTILPRPFVWDRFGGGNDKAVAQRLIEASVGLIQTDLHEIVSEAFDLLREPGIWDAVGRVVREMRHFGGEIDHTLFVAAYEGY